MLYKYKVRGKEVLYRGDKKKFLESLYNKKEFEYMGSELEPMEMNSKEITKVTKLIRATTRPGEVVDVIAQFNRK